MSWVEGITRYVFSPREEKHLEKGIIQAEAAKSDTIEDISEKPKRKRSKKTPTPVASEPDDEKAEINEEIQNVEQEISVSADSTEENMPIVPTITLEESYQSLEDVLNAMNEHAMTWGYEFSSRKSDLSSQKFVYCCSRGSTNSNDRKKEKQSKQLDNAVGDSGDNTEIQLSENDSPEKRKRKCYTKKTCCTLNVVIALRKKDFRFHVSVNGFHNHGSFPLHTFPKYRRAYLQSHSLLVSDLIRKGLKNAEILNYMNEHYPSLVMPIPQDISNMRIKLRKEYDEKLSGLEVLSGSCQLVGAAREQYLKQQAAKLKGNTDDK